MTSASAPAVMLDERLFAVFAFYCVGPFGQEGPADWVHPLRDMVRAHINTLPDTLLVPVRTFLAGCPDDDWLDYTRYAFAVGPPPGFALPGPENPTHEMFVAEIPGMQPVLRRFYESARLDSVWSVCLPTYLAVADTLEQVFQYSVDAVWEYTRAAPSEQLVQVRVVPNLLNLRNRAMLYNVPNADTLYVVRGPLVSYDAILDMWVVHELVENLVGPAVESADSLVAATEELLPLVADLPQIRNGYHGSWRAVVVESLVRAVEFRIAARHHVAEAALLDSALTIESRDGFLLIRTFHEWLATKYEPGNASLGSAVPGLLASIDVEAEKRRWAAEKH